MGGGGAGHFVVGTLISRLPGIPLESHELAAAFAARSLSMKQAASETDGKVLIAMGWGGVGWVGVHMHIDPERNDESELSSSVSAFSELSDRRNYLWRKE